MFLRLLWESFRRQRRRKLLAGAAILLGTTAVTAMLALALSIGDRIHHELAAYGANIVVYPKGEQLAVKVGGVDVKPSNGGATLQESDLDKLKGIFWANNITGISPELTFTANVRSPSGQGRMEALPALGMWFSHPFIAGLTGAPQLHPWWKIAGAWPLRMNDAAVGSHLAERLKLRLSDTLTIAPADTVSKPESFHVTGIVSTGDATEDTLLLPLRSAQALRGTPGAVSRVDLSARTKPEDALARQDPDKMSAKLHDVWYCRPYANSIAYQVQEVIAGSRAEQVRRVEQTEGTVLSRISGLMWLVSSAALLAAGFAVSAAMATAVLERRREIGLMRSLGASRSSIALLFYAESGLLAIFAGAVGYLAGSALAFWLGARIFPGASAAPLLNLVLLPVVVALALGVAIAGSAPSIRKALAMDPSMVLRVDA